MTAQWFKGEVNKHIDIQVSGNATLMIKQNATLMIKQGDGEWKTFGFLDPAAHFTPEPIEVSGDAYEIKGWGSRNVLRTNVTFNLADYITPPVPSDIYKPTPSTPPPPMVELTAAQKADLADAAADLLEDAGWTQNAEVDDDGAMCAIGALNKACRDLVRDLVGDRRQARAAARAAASEIAAEVMTFLGLPGMSIWSWNDTASRTADEVITALRDFAIKTRPDAMTDPGDQ